MFRIRTRNAIVASLLTVLLGSVAIYSNAFTLIVSAGATVFAGEAAAISPSLLAPPANTGMLASPGVLSGTYSATYLPGNRPLGSLSACTFPEDNGSAEITQSTVTITETSPGIISGSFGATVLVPDEKTGVLSPMSGTVQIGGTASAGTTSRTLSGTITSAPAGVNLIDPVFSGSWTSNAGGRTLSISVGGRVYTEDPADVCSFSGAVTISEIGIGGRVVVKGTSIGVAGVTVSLTGTNSSSQITDADGDYLFPNLTSGGNYTVTPSYGNGIFTPSAKSFSNLTSPQVGDFQIDPPFVPDVTRTFLGRYFIDGFDQDNVFNAEINWQGLPGKARFQINDNPFIEKNGTSSGASHPFNMDTAFAPGFSPSLVRITPINSLNVVGIEKTEEIYVFPYPQWLQTSLATGNICPPGRFPIDPDCVLAFSTEAGEMKAEVKLGTPDKKAYLTFPEWVPFFAGDFGMRKFSANASGSVTSAGSGSFRVGGGIEFKALSGTFGANALGTGNFQIDSNLGFHVPSANVNVTGNFSPTRSADLLSVVPGLSVFNSIPAMRRASQSARITGGGTLSVAFDGNWKQNPQGNLEFDSGTGTVGLDLIARVTFKPDPRIFVEAEVSGGANVTLGASPVLQGGELKFEAGLKVKIDKLFGGVNFNPSYIYRCNWTTNLDPDAPPLPNCPNFSSSQDLRRDLKLEMLQPAYGKFGKHESFSSRGVGKDTRPVSDSDLVLDDAGTTLVSNVFSGAGPQLLPVGTPSKMVMWTRQDGSLPVLQSTNIAWSYFDGASWSEPAVLNSDTRVEQSPVFGVDGAGRVVAAWMRVKDLAYGGSPDTFEDLPEFYRLFEVVSSVFDPNSRSWGPIGVMTDDLALDTSLRMSADSAGNLLLTWQSNPSGQFNAPTSAPATLKYTFWNGGSWNPVGEIATGLADISEHSAAIRGNNAFVVVPQDPNLEAENDSKLLAYTWNGAQWSSASMFAEGETDHLMPMAYYDREGAANVAWLKGSDMVSSPLNEPFHTVIRPDSDSLGLRNSKLITNARGDLAIVWEDVSDNGPANIFARTYNRSRNTWSGDISINNEEWQSSSSNGFLKENGDIELAYLSTQINRVTRTVTVEGETFDIPNIPEEGQTDLKIVRYASKTAAFDFDGDGKADQGVYRDGVWYLLQSRDGVSGLGFGLAGDRLVAADYDGDGKTDAAIYRDGVWWVLNSNGTGYSAVQWGIASDTPVPADYDGDGKADLAVYRGGEWWILYGNGAGYSMIQWGIASDKPVPADYDGDGKADFAVYRDGEWWILFANGSGYTTAQWGIATDKPIPADYHGDGKADYAVYRDGEWWVYNSNGGPSMIQWGIPGDQPVPADYDGDGKTDLAIYRNGEWWTLFSTGYTSNIWGIPNDIPVSGR